jgi:putative N6-adenine-specific DNA methylase
VRDLEPTTPPGFIVTNPPYGERLPADRAFHRDAARALRGLHDHTVGILTADPALSRAMRREPDKWWILYNGPLECRLLVYASR